ncbi:MAG: GspH/FimT family pseudopilin [Acidobacteriota bacterium]
MLCSKTERPGDLRHRSQRGFTLLEMLVVLTLVGILTAIAIPYLGKMSRRNQIRSAASEIQSTLLAARMRAVRRNLPASVYVTTATAAQSTHLLDTIEADTPAPTPTPLPKTKLNLPKASLAFLTLPTGGKITFDGNGRVIVPPPPLSTDIKIEGPVAAGDKNQITIRTSASGKVEVITPVVWQ